MVGFLCYVCGKTDPSEFFYGMRLTFDGPPHLVQLKQAIEARAVQDSALPDGSRYVITDLEILDLRLNMWTPLDSRTQLYSGCHVCAIRDNGSATSSGPIDIARKLPQQRALGFALDVESTFRALDVENRGLVSLSNVLHVFRHDLNYAVDFFQMIDVRNCGQVTMQDLMSATAKKNSDFWKELQLRISRGGLDPGITSNRAGLNYLNENNSGGVVPYRGAGSNTSSPVGTPRSGVPSPMSKLGFKPGSGAASNNSVTPSKRQGIAAAILASARQQKEDETRKETGSVISGGGQHNNHSFGSGDGSPPGSPGPGNSESKAVSSAKKVVALFQQASRPKLGGGTPAANGGGGGEAKGVTGAMARMKELASKASTSTRNPNNSAASATGSNSTMNSPAASKRK